MGAPGQEFVEPMRRMLKALHPRGPDDSGFLVLPDGILGHTRLAIVDLTGGHQPMSSALERHHIVFNGEIYGYKDLRPSFGDFPYRTSSDTEVILAAYARHGMATAQHLPGMFAFAIWDETRHRLLCARDRFGEKPFYFAMPQPGVIVFASELKAILASGLVTPEVDPCAVAYYLKRHYVHPWKSIYRNVHALPPAHCLSWDGARVERRRYWIVPSSSNETLTLDSAAEVLREKMRAAVESQLIADVEVGAFLSGGLDSTTIVGLAAESSKQLRTFCADFEGQASEAPFARLAAERYGTDHVELRVGSFSLPEVLTTLAGIYDEPFADNSNVPTYLIAQRAREHVKVVLTGDGGDELFGGYGWYRALCWAERNPSPSWWRWMTARLLARTALTMGLPIGSRLEERNIGIGMMRRERTVIAAHVDQMGFCSDVDLQQLGLGDCAAEIRGWDESLIQGDGVSGAMNFDVQGYMAGDILTKVDRASMANGLELRAPFLDVKLGEFALSLPAQLRVTSGEDKRVLRAAFADSWPDAIRRRGKHGFGAPVNLWLDSPALSGLVQSALWDSDAPVNDVVDPVALRRRYEDGGALERWAVFALGLWAQRWLPRHCVSG